MIFVASANQYIDPDPDEEPTRRTHCIQCGGFLPKDPQVSEKRDPDTGVMYDIDAIWTCKKCGREHTADEVWE